MIDFEYKALPWNVVFGVGRRHRLSTEMETLGLSKALVLCTPYQREQAEQISGALADKSGGIFDQAKMHVPGSTVSEAIEAVTASNADCTISIGGGSTTGLGKALALKLDLANIAVPTTYAGSEMTNIWGITENGRKVTGRDNKVLPNLVVYDPELTLSLPTNIAAPSGVNAMAQAVVNVATDKPNPIISNMAAEAVATLAQHLPKIISDPCDLGARSGALYGACLAGAALGTGITSLHHRLCHTLGGTYNTPHAETHAILLPHSVAFNASSTREGTARLAQALGRENAGLALFDLLATLKIPRRLSDIGIVETDIDDIVRISLESPVNNPEPVTKSKLATLLTNAVRGLPPEEVSA